MLTPEENTRVTRVGPGTPMGALMRRYWQPACLSSELPESDGAPLRVRLLGEDLIAFRDTSGAVGLVDAFQVRAADGDVLELQRAASVGLTVLWSVVGGVLFGGGLLATSSSRASSRSPIGIAKRSAAARTWRWRPRR